MLFYKQLILCTPVYSTTISLQTQLHIIMGVFTILDSIYPIIILGTFYIPCICSCTSVPYNICSVGASTFMFTIIIVTQ